MALDPNIILQAGHPSVQLENPLDLAQKATAVRQLQQRAQLQDMEIAQQQATRNAYNQAATTNPDGSVSFDPNKIVTGMVQSGQGQAGYQAGQQFMQNSLAQQKAQMQMQSDRLAFVHQSLGTVNDQASLDQHNLAMKVAGIPNANQTPTVWNPQTAQWIAQKYKITSDATQRSKEIDQNIASRKNDIEAYAAGMPGMGGAKAAPITPDTDPATLINTQVRKEQREKVGDEIKNAQDIVKLKPDILAAFDKGNSRDPIQAAQGQHAFLSLIGTTVKDKEDSARASAFQLIHDNMAPKGFSQLPGDNASRRKNVVDYLASKASAPMAKANKIDLTKFKSTNFNDGNVNMQAPDGTVRSIPLDKVKDALAAGGKEI